MVAALRAHSRTLGSASVGVALGVLLVIVLLVEPESSPTTPAACAYVVCGQGLVVGNPQSFQPSVSELGCRALDYCYRLVLESVPEGIPIRVVALEILAASGTVLQLNHTGGAAILSASDTIVANATIQGGASFNVTRWTPGEGFSPGSELLWNMTMVLDLGSSPNPHGAGLDVVASLTNAPERCITSLP